MNGAPRRLRCEYLEDPRGIDLLRPRLSWCVGDSRPAELQTAYQLLAASRPDLLAMNEGDLWDSDRVDGRETSQIEYAGKPLVSGRSVWWKVRSYDSDGLPSAWSEAGFFEVGLLEDKDWQGHWISSGLQGSRICTAPVPLFGRRFELDGTVRSARLYVAALGQVAVQLNGRRIGASEQAPSWVDYAQRVDYQVFDVTAALEEGSNGLAILLADGWYAGDPGSGNRQQYGVKPAMLIQLNISLERGNQLQLSSDSAWRWQPSWILASDPTRGEQVDGTRSRPDWLEDGPETSGWYPVERGLAALQSGIHIAASGAVSARMEQLVPATLRRWQTDTRRLLFEFPQPLMGRVKVTVIAPEGAAVWIRYGLDLDPAGDLIVLGEDSWVAAGSESGESFEALFSLHGFRYVEVAGDVFSEDAVAVAAVTIGRAPAAQTVLVADHLRLNSLHDNLLGHLRATQQAVSMAGLLPTDRLGGVAAFGAAAGALLLNLDSAAIVQRWLRDMADAQFPDGGFPAVVPSPPSEEALCGEGPAGASASFVEVLWQLFRHTGDRRTLRQYFPAVKQLLGGGVEVARDFIREDLEGVPGYPADLVATAWFYRSARLAARLAGVLGQLSDLEDFEELAGNIRNSFRRRFVTPDGLVIGDSAAVYALTLGFGLLDRAEQRTARQALIRLVEVGLRGSVAEHRELLAVPWLLRVLCDHGRLDLAYRLVLETAVTHEAGAGGRDMGALIGAGVHEWLFATLSGFTQSRDLSEAHNAFRHVIIAPRPPLGVGYDIKSGEPPVREVEAELTTINGRYESSWRITELAFELRVLVPGNCSAEIVLPDGTRHEVAGGAHEFNVAFGESGDGIPVLREVS